MRIAFRIFSFQASQEFTTVIVAHRLSTVRNADRIIVYSEGKIVEEGSHQELMEQQGAYYNLVTAQMSDNCVIDDIKGKARNKLILNI